MKLSGVRDTRDAYKVKVQINIETCANNSYTWNDIVEVQRCIKGKFDPEAAGSRMDGLINTAKREAEELLSLHLDELAERAAVLRAKEEAGEVC